MMTSSTKTGNDTGIPRFTSGFVPKPWKITVMMMRRQGTTVFRLAFLQVICSKAGLPPCSANSYHKQGVNPAAVLHIIRDLASNVQSTLIEGEMLDIIYSKRPVASLNENLIIDMLWKKTGALYELAGRTGAMIGLDTEDVSHGLVESLSTFASQCGTAFQLQDDILGVVGDEQLLGKPVGSDIREGKRTTIVHYALEQATVAQKAELLGILGNEQATENEIGRVAGLLVDLGGVQRTPH